MTREDWNQLNNEYQSKEPWSEEKWRRDVIRLLVAIAEEIWKLRNKT